MSQTGFHPGDGGPSLKGITDGLGTMLRVGVTLWLLLLVIAVWA